MTHPHLIALTGYAGSGKDTVRAMLEQRGYTGLAFADPIRAMLRELLRLHGICSGYMDDRALKEAAIPELGVSYRQLAQTLGTEWGRAALHPDFWLRLAGARMADLADFDGATHFVISDVRFANEAAWVRERGGVIWRVTRPDCAPVRAHTSEAEIDRLGHDQSIDNSGSLQKLQEAVYLAVYANQLGLTT